MESSNNHDECEFDQNFFSDLVQDNFIESQIEDGVPNTRERAGMGIKELRYKRKAEVAIGRDPCPDTRDWSKAKRLRADQKGTVVRNDMLPFDIIANKKSAAIATWLPELGLVEITQMRGNFWRTTGFCTNKKSYLYPEEALLLAERSVLLIDYQGERVAYHKLYEDVIDIISLECHLAYLKLKSLDYLVFRHGKCVRSFEGDADVHKYLSKHPDTSLLKAVVSYDVYSHTHKWSKKMMLDPPAAHIVVMTGDLTFSGRLLVQLLDESKGIPIIFAAVMPTGHVMLEEFSDSLITLNWENVYAKAIEFRSKIEKSLVITACKNDQNDFEKEESNDDQNIEENDKEEIDNEENENENVDGNKEGSDEEYGEEQEVINLVDDSDENEEVEIDVENIDDIENIDDNEEENEEESDEENNSDLEKNILEELDDLLDDDLIDFSAGDITVTCEGVAEVIAGPDSSARASARSSEERKVPEVEL